MRVETLKRLIALVEESGISELEIRRWGGSVRISKQEGIVATQVNPTSALELEAPGPAKEVEKRPEDLVAINSPMVGTFYRAPSPDAPSYVEVGDFVKPGQVVCIIEAMKLMNEIEAEVAGEVVKAVAKNGEPVEYGQELFLIRPA